MLTNLRLRWRALWKRRQLESDLEDELGFHLAMREEKNRQAGVAENARRSFGNPALVKEDLRDQWTFRAIETFWKDLRYAARMLRRSPAFTLVAIASLAIGIGANTAIFSIVNAVLFRPLPLPSGERVTAIRVKSALAGETEGHASAAQFLAWREDHKAFDLLTAAEGLRIQISGIGDPEEVRGLQVSSEFSQLTGVHPRIGSGLREDDFRNGSKRACLISTRLWRRRFSEAPGVLGRTVYLDSAPAEIVGVLPEDIAFPDTETDVWTALRFTPDHQERRSLDVYGRLRNGVPVRDAQVRLDQATARAEMELPDWLKSRGVTVTPIREQVISDERALLLVLSGIATCVLLICCTNVGNLLLARHLNREREIALRASLGATRARLICQLLTESLVLCVSGAVAGCAVARGLLTAGYGLLSDSRYKALLVTGDRLVDVRVVGFTLLIALLTTVLFGLIPSRYFTRVSLNGALKASVGGRESSYAESLLSRHLIAIELGVVFILLVGTGLLARSFVGLLAVDRGYTVDHLLTARLPMPARITVTLTQRKQFFSQLIENLKAMPGVRGVGVVTGLPLGGLNATMTLPRPGQPVDPENLPWVGINCVSPDYFGAMGIRFLRGRGFDSKDGETGMKIAVVNETLARQFWPNRDAIGQELTPGTVIVGVVQDIRQEALDTSQGPTYYLPFDQRDSPAAAPNFVVVRTSGDPKAVIPALKEGVRAVDHLQPVLDMRTMEDVLTRSITQRRILASWMGGFAALAVVLSIMGIYGVLSFLVNRRSREIGIRMCLGAQRRQILSLLARQLFLRVAVGLLAGLTVSLMLTRVLSRWLFAIHANDPLTLIAAAVITAAVAMLGGLAPAVRAVSVDPSTAVRME